MTTDELVEILNHPILVNRQTKDSYIAEGFVKIENALAPQIMSHMINSIDPIVFRSRSDMRMAERSTYDQAFIQSTNLWRKDKEIRRFVFGRRLAQIAAELMGVKGVRLYHDQALYKEPGGGFTPWHADQYYWPLASDKCITAWIPLQDTPLEMGPLEFSARSHHMKAGRDLEISDESETHIASALDHEALQVCRDPFMLGDVTFHSGWTFHRAGPNTTRHVRKVMTIIYMDAEMRLKKPENKHQQADWDTWCPGTEIGAIIDTDLNPVLFSKN